MKTPDNPEMARRTRKSIAFFANSDEDVLVESLDGSNKYPPILAHQYFKMRLSESMDKSYK